MTQLTKTMLLADVGGTNTRIALSRGDELENIQHFQNDLYNSLYDVIRAYLAQQGAPCVDACCVAMAGPVEKGAGRLTNRGWDISTDGLEKSVGCASATLLNDLTALGHALSHLPDTSRQALHLPQVDAANDQYLVVGIGTGFNLCPVRQDPDGKAHCLEVEMGHASLPYSVRHGLQEELGTKASDFPTLEHLFSGDGLSRFHQARTGDLMTAKQVVEAQTAGDAKATQTLTLYMALLVDFCAELSFQYMPMSGMYFAGSVARGLLQPEFSGSFSRDHDATGKVGQFLHRVPKWLILDDAAALKGCRAAIL